MAGQTPELQQQNLQSSEKSQHFKEKHNIKWTPCIFQDWLSRPLKITKDRQTDQPTDRRRKDGS